MRTTEKETVAGPRGMRYHKRCLKCGCGRELDSEARVGERGQLSCEGCRVRSFFCFRPQAFFFLLEMKKN